jgi:hypothetical protein
MVRLFKYRVPVKKWQETSYSRFYHGVSGRMLGKWSSQAEVWFRPWCMLDVPVRQPSYQNMDSFDMHILPFMRMLHALGCRDGAQTSKEKSKSVRLNG